MKESKSYRINLHEQIKAFYSIVYNGEFDLKPTHISLYMFLLNQNNRSMWIEWFKCPFDLAMQGAAISSRTTYYKCLDDLTKFKLIEYERGLNNFKAPKIKIIPLTIPKNGLVTVPLPDTLLGTLPVHIIRLITNNITLITIHFAKIAKFIETLKKQDEQKKDAPPDFIDQIINAFVEEHGTYEVMSRGVERKMAAKILAKYKKKNPDATSDDALRELRFYFKRCVFINDPWLRDNMSLSTIVSKFNSINTILSNGKSKIKGATSHQVANAVAKNFADDYPLHSEEHAENNESIPYSITRIL